MRSGRHVRAGNRARCGHERGWVLVVSHGESLEAGGVGLVVAAVVGQAGNVEGEVGNLVAGESSPQP